MHTSGQVKCANCDYVDSVADQPDQHICRVDPGTIQVVPSQGLGGVQLRVVTFWRPVKADTDWCGRFIQRGTWRG